MPVFYWDACPHGITFRRTFPHKPDLLGMNSRRAERIRDL